jgi:predicted MFS family arabinose efflux permease
MAISALKHCEPFSNTLGVCAKSPNAMTRTFWIAAFVVFTNALSITILIPVLYLYGKQFGLSDFKTSLLFATYAIAQFLAAPILGNLSDRYGRRPLLVLSIAGTVIANLIAGLATAAWVLFLARFLDGITGGNNSIAQAMVSDITTPETRARGFGILGASLGLGFVLGPAMSLFAQNFSLGASFLLSASVAFVGLLSTAFFLPETLKHRRREPWTIQEMGLVELVKGLAYPRVGILLIINFLIGTTFTIFTFGFQPYFLKVLGQNNKTLTLTFLLIGTLAVIMQTQGLPRLTQQFGLTRLFLLSLLVRSGAFLLMPLVPQLSYFLCVSAVFALFNGLVQPLLNTLISLNATAEQQGVVMGLNASYLSVSNAFGPVIAGIIMDQAHPETYRYPLYLAGILTFCVFFWAWRSRRYYTPQSTTTSATKDNTVP